MKVGIARRAREFAEDKDVAAEIRKQFIAPQVQTGKIVTLDFTGVQLATQSFVHALISDVLRQHGEKALTLVKFKGCSKLVRGIVETVVQYSLETIDEK